MGLLVNRRPVSDEDLSAILEHHECPEYIGDSIGAEDLDSEGRRLLRLQEVEGQPADCLIKHGTRWGRHFCAATVAD